MAGETTLPLQRPGAHLCPAEMAALIAIVSSVTISLVNHKWFADQGPGIWNTSISNCAKVFHIAKYLVSRTGWMIWRDAMVSNILQPKLGVCDPQESTKNKSAERHENRVLGLQHR